MWTFTSYNSLLLNGHLLNRNLWYELDWVARISSNFTKNISSSFLFQLDLFSNQPEMIEVNVNEIIKRWTPNTNLTQLFAIKNKYFHQTNVLGEFKQSNFILKHQLIPNFSFCFVGKIVNIVRKVKQEPKFKFKDTDTIKIPQFYKSGYITITLLK